MFGTGYIDSMADLADVERLKDQILAKDAFVAMLVVL